VSDAADPFPLLDYLDKLIEDLRAHVRPAIDEAEPGQVHKARVSTRRLKAALDLLRPVIDDDRRKPLARVLKKLRKTLGPLRDMEVMRGHLEDMAKGRHADAVAWLNARLTDEADQLRKKTRRKNSPSRLLAKLDAWLDVRDQTAEAREAMHSLLSQSLHLQVDAFAEQAGLLTAHERTNVHALRIAGKNLRYTLELADEQGLELPRKTIRTFKRMQDALGLWHDFVVLAQHTMEECVEADLPQCEHALQGKMLEFTRRLMARSEAHLDRFSKLWSKRGAEICAEVRDAFPLTSGISESKTGPDLPGSDEIPTPEAPPPGAVSAA
jgi:CHAD domain-containing protein